MKNSFNLTTSSQQTKTNLKQLKKSVACIAIGTALIFTPISNIEAYSYNSDTRYYNSYEQSSHLQIGTPVVVPSNTHTYRYNENNRRITRAEKTEEPYNFGIYEIKSAMIPGSNIFSNNVVIKEKYGNIYLRLSMDNNPRNDIIVESSDIIKYMGPSINPLEYNLQHRIGSQVIIPSKTPIYFIKDGEIYQTDQTTNEPYWQGESKITQIWTQGRNNIYKQEYISQFFPQETCFASVDIDGTGKNIKIFCLNDLLVFVPQNITKYDNIIPNYEPINNRTINNIQLYPSIKIMKKEANYNDLSKIGLLHIRWIDDQLRVHAATIYPNQLFGKDIKMSDMLNIEYYSFNNSQNEIAISLNGQTYSFDYNDIINSMTTYANTYRREQPNNNIELNPGYYYGPDGKIYDRNGNEVQIIPSSKNNINDLKNFRNEINYASTHEKPKIKIKK